MYTMLINVMMKLSFKGELFNNFQYIKTKGREVKEMFKRSYLVTTLFFAEPVSKHQESIFQSIYLVIIPFLESLLTRKFDNFLLYFE